MQNLNSSAHWVFLRGLARDSAHWEEFPDRFAESIPNAGIFLADLPGSGKHWRLKSPTDITAMAEFVRQDSLNADKRLIGPRYLFAISLGAMVALEWLHRHPSDIAGLVLVNTSLRGFNPIHQRLCWRSWPKLFSIACQNNVRVRESAILALTTRLGNDASTRVESRVKAFQQHPFARMNLIRQLWAAAKYRPPLNIPQSPLIMLNSLGDRLVNPACSQTIVENWGVTLSTHPWGGHDLPLDDPDWIIAEVLHWLQDQDYFL